MLQFEGSRIGDQFRRMADAGRGCRYPGLGRLLLATVVATVSLFAQFAQRPEFTIETVAGTHGVGDGGPLPEALVYEPQGIVVDIDGAMFFAVRLHHRIRRITSGGQVSTLAGRGVPGGSGDAGRGVDALLNRPSDVAFDNMRNLYIADTNNRRVRKVNVSGIITTVAGTGVDGSAGDGGSAVAAELGLIEGIALDPLGNLYIADTTNHRVRKVDLAGKITTIAGTGEPGFSGDGGPAAAGQLDSPTGVAVGRPGTARAGAVFIADHGNHRIRMVKDGVITTLAGNGADGFAGDGGGAAIAEVGRPRKVMLDQGANLYVSQETGSRVRRINPAGLIERIAGSGFGFGGDVGPAVDALMRNPEGIARRTDGAVFIADAGNHRIRRVLAGTITTHTGRPHNGGDGGAATEADLFMPFGIETDNQTNLYIADTLNHRVRKVTFVGDAALGEGALLKGAPEGTITTIAGKNNPGFSGDGGLGPAAQLNEPRDVAVGRQKNVYIADRGNHRVRRLTPEGRISTYAGDGVAGFGGDGGPATAAQFHSPSAVAIDLEGTVYVADTLNHRIRKVDVTGVISTIAGTGMAGFGGDGGPATSAALDMPTGLELDGEGNLFVSDTSNRRIRMIRTDGVIVTVAGSGMGGGGGDGGLATEAGLDPWDVAVDRDGNLYIADSTSRIRRVVNPASLALGEFEKGRAPGIISTVAGTGVAGFSGDGLESEKAQVYEPLGVTVDILGNVFVADASNNVIRVLSLDTPVKPLVTTEGVVDAASFGPRLGPGSIGTAFVLNAANSDVAAMGSPLPTKLGGTVLQIIDSEGITRDLGLFGIFGGGTQVNIFIQDETAVGPGLIVLRRSEGAVSSAPIEITQTGAGIFFAPDQTGHPIALAQFLRVIPNGAAAPLELTFDPANLTLVPIDLGPSGDRVFLVLFCTGLRFADEVRATFDGQEVPVFGFAPSPGFFGLDQVNIGPIPRDFRFRGKVDVQLIVDGVLTNVVEVSFD